MFGKREYLIIRVISNSETKIDIGISIQLEIYLNEVLSKVSKNCHEKVVAMT